MELQVRAHESPGGGQASNSARREPQSFLAGSAILVVILVASLHQQRARADQAPFGKIKTPSAWMPPTTGALTR